MLPALLDGQHADGGKALPHQQPGAQAHSLQQQHLSPQGSQPGAANPETCCTSDKASLQLRSHPSREKVPALPGRSPWFRKKKTGRFIDGEGVRVRARVYSLGWRRWCCG